MTALPLPDRHNTGLAFGAFDLAVSPSRQIDRGQRGMPLASDKHLFPIAMQREAGDFPINRQIGEFIHPYRSHSLLPLCKVTKRTQRVNAGEYPKLTLRLFGEKS